ncbi:MAG: hypothetical protein EWM47_11135 [Anaerolineaceae bacterium]|nr:MAG: hypothetical protein EWM47_11135 [Anaerolineaceae bacterium]
MMNIKAATKYQLNEYIKSVRIFYLVVILVTLFFGGIVNFGDSSNVNMMGGTEMSTAIFLFVLGLNSFKETFLMMLQNSTTRKTMFVSRLIAVLATGVSMAIIDRFIISFAKLFTYVNENYQVSGMYEMVFQNRAESLHTVIMNLEAILITIGVYIAAIIAGYFITTAYYRMNKILKVAVSVGVPVTLFFLLPIIDMSVYDGKISRAIGKLFAFVFGGESGNPYNLLISCLLFSVVGIGLSWLLIRKAVEKN